MKRSRLKVDPDRLRSRRVAPCAPRRYSTEEAQAWVDGWDQCMEFVLSLILGE